MARYQLLQNKTSLTQTPPQSMLFCKRFICSLHSVLHCWQEKLTDSGFMCSTSRSLERRPVPFAEDSI